jgi:hypothetical protein
MKERDKTLLKSWIGQIQLDGKPLRQIGAGQAVVLRALNNGFVTEGNEPTPDDMVEIILVMSQTREEMTDYIDMDKEDRNQALAKFAAYHIEEIDGVIAQVAQSLERLGQSVMDSDNVGKEIRHAS